MLFLGIDHSLNKTAIVCVNENGHFVGKTIYKNKKHKGEKRLLMLLKFITKLLKRYGSKISCIGIENYSFGSKGRAIFNIGEAGGILRLLLWCWMGKKQRIYWCFAPKTVKKFASGNGNSNKDKMIKAVKDKWKFDAEEDHDVADAFAVAQLTRSFYLYNVGKRKTLSKDEIDVMNKIGT